MAWTYQYGNKLGEKLANDQFSVDITDMCSLKETDANKTYIEALVEFGLENLPEDEELNNVEILITPFKNTTVRVWCMSNDFNYENNTCESERVRIGGDINRTIDVMLDVRPF